MSRLECDPCFLCDTMNQYANNDFPWKHTVKNKLKLNPKLLDEIEEFEYLGSKVTTAGRIKSKS